MTPCIIKDVNQPEHLYIAGGNVNQCNHFRKLFDTI